MDGREILDYSSALKWLASLDETRVKPGLERIRQLAARLGHPQQQLHAVIVGGTNGKGSCCWLLEDALCRAGIRVGCATSPHLHSVRERLRLDGELVCGVDANGTYYDGPALPGLWDVWVTVATEGAQVPYVLGFSREDAPGPADLPAP